MTRDSGGHTGTRTLPEGGRPWRRMLVLTAAWLALLAFVLAGLEAWPGAGAWSRLAQPRLWPATLGFIALFLAAMALRARRWQVLLRARIALPWPRIWPVFFWTFLIKSLTPLRAGEVTRALWLRREVDGGFGYGLGTLVVERLADAVVLIGGGTLVLVVGLLPLPRPDGLARAGIAALAVLALVVVVFRVAPRGPLRRLLRRLRPEDPVADVGRPGVVRRVARAAIDSAASMARALAPLRDPALAAHVLGLTALIWAGLALAFGLILQTLLPALPWPAVVAVLVAVNVVGMTMAAPANLGSFEVAGVAVLAAFGIDAGDALPAVVLVHAAVLGSTLLGGIIGRIMLRGELSSALDLY